MSIISQSHSLPLPSGSHDAGIPAMPSPAQRAGDRQPVKPRPSGVPTVMGPANHAPGVPVMGAPHAAPQLDVMGGPDRGPHLDVMGRPDTGQRVHVMGESDLTFVDSLFGQRRSLR
jgi:hypothetical protein